MLVALACLLLAAPGCGVAAAQPSTGPEPGGGAYGFDQTCDKIHHTFDFGVPGFPSIGDGISGACQAANAGTHPGQALHAAADEVWSMTFGKIVASLLNGLGQLIVMSLTFWVRLPNSGLADTPTLFDRISTYTYDAQLYLLMISLLVCGVRLVEARRHASMEETSESFRVLARTIMANSAWTFVLVAGTRAGDAFANWMIADATHDNAKGVAESMVQTAPLTAFSPGLVLIVAIVALLGALAQVVLAVVRQGLLVVVAAILPLAAAGSGTRTGKQFYERLLQWSLAFLLWKPVAAMVYTVAFVTADTTALPNQPSSTPTTEAGERALVGIVLLCSAAFTLPALMRLVSPIPTFGGTSGAAAAAGALGLAGAGIGLKGRLATGAANSHGGNVSRRNPPPGAGPPGGGPPPSGPPGGGPAGAGPPPPGGPAGAAGAAAAAGIAAVGRGVRAADERVTQAATGLSATTSRPTGHSGGASEVPR